MEAPPTTEDKAVWLAIRAKAFPSFALSPLITEDKRLTWGSLLIVHLEGETPSAYMPSLNQTDFPQFCIRARDPVCGTQ